MTRHALPLALYALVLGVAGCAPLFGGDPFGHAEGDRIGELIDQPAGPIIELGEVPIEGDPEGRSAKVRAFRNRADGICTEQVTPEGGGMGCSGGPGGGPTRSLPADGPVGMGWSSSTAVVEGDDQQEICVEVDAQDEITRVAVTDASGATRDLVRLRASQQLGMNLFFGCWRGSEPRAVEAFIGDGERAYRSEM